MDYNSIKKEIESVRREITKLKRDISKNKEEQGVTSAALARIENNYQNNLVAARNQALETFIKGRIKKYDDEILRLSEQINDENEIYTEKRQHYETSDIFEFYTNESTMLAEVKTSIEVLQKYLERTLSKRFKRELETQLDSGNIDLQGDNLEAAINFFNKESVYVAGLSKENRIDNVILAINDFCIESPFSFSDDKRTASAQTGGIVLAVGVLMILLAKFIFPFYFVFLAFLSVYNVQKHYRVYSALIAQKVVKDNVNKIDEKLKSDAEKRLEKVKRELDENHLTIIADIQSKIVHAKNEMNAQKALAESEFVFDDSTTRKEYETLHNINAKKMDSLIANQKDLEKQLDEKYENLSKLQKELDEIAGTIQAEYLDFNKVGTDVIFKPDFIFDIQKGKPVYFKHPSKSCLFIYDDNSDVIDFIRLICIQLRIKLNPFNLSITVMDTKFAGLSYLHMQPQSDGKDKSISKLFQVLPAKDTINKYLDECIEEVHRKIAAILRQFKSISDYNQFMVENDSLTEGYEFIFFQDPENNDLQDERLKQIINTGSNVGVFMHLFISKEAFYEMGDTARSFVNNVGRIYVLSEGAYYERAKDFVLENLIKPVD